ncbi:MAG: hypothetical protein JWO32_1143 [Bacteroidetes bacterium]|nr:hypothetical protein [Bacteroidota bacterium]
MKYLKFVLLNCFLLLISFNLSAQNIHPLFKAPQEKLGFRYFITKTPWRVQVGWHVVDDDGKPFKDLFDVKKSWNILPYPTKVSVEKECYYNWNVELAFAYNIYKGGKQINGEILTDNKSFYSIDLNGKYLLTRKYRIEPYLLIGGGYTHRATTKYTSVPTLNAGFGATIWVLDEFIGINLQATGKLGLLSPIYKSGSNYTQHSVCVLVKFSGNSRRLKAARAHLNTIF